MRRRKVDFQAFDELGCVAFLARKMLQKLVKGDVDQDFEGMIDRITNALMKSGWLSDTEAKVLISMLVQKVVKKRKSHGP